MFLKDGIRINKYVKDCGIASRREADQLVEEGRVLINGKVALPGSMVKENDLVTVDGNTICLTKEKHIVAFYKPLGVTCTKKDAHAQTTIDDVFIYPYPLTYAGRLDKDSEGLLILTDDGDLIDAMMRSRYGHEKEYEVTFAKELTQDFIERFSEGVFLPELETVTKPCLIGKLDKKKATVILTQGLNRQIRRMGKVLGNEVVSIKRIRVVNIKLKELNPGEYRELSPKERDDLYRFVKGEKD